MSCPLLLLLPLLLLDMPISSYKSQLRAAAAAAATQLRAQSYKPQLPVAATADDNLFIPKLVSWTRQLRLACGRWCAAAAAAMDNTT
jgi:hypothetical protein